MSNVTDIVEKDNQQPMRDQVITMESELILYLFVVEMSCLVLELKMSKVTDIPEKDNQEPMRDQVITMDSELILCLSVECCSHLKNIQNFCLSGNLYS